MSRESRLTFAFVFAFACAVLASGCAGYEPAPLDPGAEFAALRAATLDGLVVERARPGDGPGTPAAPFDAADGLDEDELVAVALTLHPALRARRLARGEAHARLIEAGLWPNPGLGVTWRSGIGGATGHSVDADLLLDLLQPSRRAARVDAAAAQQAEAEAGVVAEEWRVVREVRLRRLDVLAAEQALALLDEERTLREHALDLTRRRRAAGDGTALDVSAAEVDLAEVRRDRFRAESDVQAARRALNEVLGLPPEHAVALTGSGRPLAVTVFEDPTDEELERRLLAGRFELRAMEASYARADQELRLAVLGRFPGLSAGLSYTREADGAEQLGPTAEVEIPLFQRNQGEIAARTNARDRARAEYVETLHRLRAEAYEARAGLRRARLEVEMQERDVLPLVRRSRELVESAYAAREASVFDRVASQERALRARQAWLSSVVRYRRGVVEFESATGMPLARTPDGGAAPGAGTQEP